MTKLKAEELKAGDRVVWEPDGCKGTVREVS